MLPRNGRSRRSKTAYGRINQQHRRMAEEPHHRIGKNRRRTVIVAGDEMTGVYTVELFKNRAFPLHIDLLGKVILNYYVLTLPSQGEFDIHPITTSYPAISTAPPLLPLSSSCSKVFKKELKVSHPIAWLCRAQLLHCHLSKPSIATHLSP